MNREEAIGKINGEMQKSPDDRVLEAIGHYLIDRITDADAEKVRDKTLKGAVEKMRSAAQKVARGGLTTRKLGRGSWRNSFPRLRRRNAPAPPPRSNA